MKTIVFGGGYFGVNYIRELGHHVVGVVEPKQERADFIKKTYNVQVYPELPEDLDYDSAIVVTPPHCHITTAEQVLKTGRFCLIEKPLSFSVEEAMRLLKYRNKIMAGMVYLYHPEVELLREALSSYPVNHVFTRRTNHGPIREDTDALWDLAPHDISILNYITQQRPIGISCYKERDWAVLNLEYLGFPTCTYVSWLGAPKTRLVEIVFQPNTEFGESDNRLIFDDMKVVLEVSPLRRMLNDFMTGD